MSTNAFGRVPHAEVRVWHGLSAHWAWLAGGFVLAFAVPFSSRTCSRRTATSSTGSTPLRSSGYSPFGRIDRVRPRRGCQAPLDGGTAARVGRRSRLGRDGCPNEDATARPHGLELAGALAWRGVLYGVTDGLLLSVFPILVVFAAFAGTRLNSRLAGKVVIGIVALAASLAMTAIYHSGYSDFRSDKMTKPLRGDVIWSAPTLLTLNPIGAPIAHVGLHTSAVLHSYRPTRSSRPTTRFGPPRFPLGFRDRGRKAGGDNRPPCVLQVWRAVRAFRLRYTTDGSGTAAARTTSTGRFERPMIPRETLPRSADANAP